MERKNYIVKLRLSDDEMTCFKNIQPLISLSMNRGESNMIARLLGYGNLRELTIKGFKDNPFLRNAFGVLCFLHASREDNIAFNEFWERCLFTDKDIELKVRRTFNINENKETLSVPQLYLMWLLETDKDELDAQT